MKTDTKILLAFIIVLVGGLVIWKFTRNTGETPASIEEQAMSLQNQSPSLKSKLSPAPGGPKSGAILNYQDDQGAPKTEALTEYEKNFAVMAQTIFEIAKEKKTKEDFIERLQKLGLRPIVAEDKQELIEDLTIIRTQNTLPGLRYIHAQFDGDGVQELQHLSFEIAKGKDAKQKAVDLIQKILPLNKPVPNTSEFMTIFRQGDYVVSVSELEPEDVRNHPFNGYEPSDVGNIRVAIEREIHGHQDGGDDHGHEH